MTIIFYHSPVATWLRIPSELTHDIAPVLKSHNIKYSAKRSEWYSAQRIEPSALQSILGTFAPVVEMTQPTAKERYNRIKEKPIGVAPIRDNVYPLPYEKQVVQQSIAPRLRKVADGLTKQIDAKLNSGTASQNPTPKRQRVLDGQRADAARMQRIQRVLYALADQWDSATIDAPWANITSKSDLEKIDVRMCYPNHDGYVYSSEVGTWESWGVTRDTFDTFMAEYNAMAAGVQSVVSDTQRQIAELERSIQFSRIDGFWSTPMQLAHRMAEMAHLAPGMRVLEPSAGKGNIADAIRALCPDAVIDVAERNYTLSEILKLKGYKVISNDCLSIESSSDRYDRCLLNPPFESGQDMAHVLHCYSLLTPGGRLVAIVGAGAIHNSTNKHKAFQAWLDDCHCYTSSDNWFTSTEDLNISL